MLSAVFTTILYLSKRAPASQPWRFDTTSALIGAAVALLLVGLAYRFRDELRLGWETVMEPLARLRHRLQTSAEDRYRELFTTWARTLAVPATVALDAVFVEPKFLRPPWPPPSPSEATPVPAGPQVIPLRRTLGGHPWLAILGAPGMGRTTVLAYIGLACARGASEGDDLLQAGAPLGPVQGRWPLYVPLPAMDWSEMGSESEKESHFGKLRAGHRRERPFDYAQDRLLRAAVAAVGGSPRMMHPLRQRLQAGEAVVLADGWDELGPQQRRQATAWLAELVEAAPGNIWLVGAGTRGYADLTEAGFVPLPLSAWDAGQVETFAGRWVEASDRVDDLPPAERRRLVAELQTVARAGAPPLELALQVTVFLSDGQVPAGRAALFERGLDLLLKGDNKDKDKDEEAWSPAVCRTVLGRVALSLQQEGRTIASREEIDSAIEAALPPPEERPARAAAHVFRTLTGARGPLRRMGSERYALAHPLWQAYLAARQLVDSDGIDLVEQLDDPQWAEALRFYAELGDMGPLVAAQLQGPDDLFDTRLHTLCSWVRAAPEDAAWRDGAMAALARAFLQHSGPGPVRQALAKALAVTGAPGITYFFKQAVQHPDVDARVAAAVGLTRTADESDLPALEAVLEDEDQAVREAVVRGLAYLGIDAATRWLVRMVLEGDDTLKPVAAEALAQCGEEGMAFLHRAITSEDVMVRRAAVFGLIQAEARDALERVAREDDQWIVRSAASVALEDMEAQEKAVGVAPAPEIEELPWLISWAAAQGGGVGTGDAARRTLWVALHEGDAPVRLAAAQVLTHIGRPDDIEPLRTALADPDPAVANAALEALAEIGRRYDVRIESGQRGSA